eukprot:13034956-Ditylum_brightwellii.AAC.1
MKDFCDTIAEIICTSIDSGFLWIQPLENHCTESIRSYSCGARCLSIAHAHDGAAHFIHRGWLTKVGELRSGWYR